MLSTNPLLPSLAWPSGRPRPPALLTVPALIIGAAMALPLAYLAVRSLGAPSEAWELFFRVRTAQILWRSILLVLVVTSGTLLIGVPLAWLTARTDMPMRRLLSVLVALPLVIPTYVGGFLAISALGPRGLVQGMLEPLGVSRLPEIYGLPGASATLILLSYPYVYLTVRAALMRMDPSLDESARLLGHGTTSTFFRLTLPQLRPAMISGSLLVALYTLSDFGAVSLMRYESFTWAIYQQYQAAFARSIAAVLALGLVGLAAVVLVVESLARGRSRYYRSSSGSERSQSVIELRMLRWPAAGFVWLVVLAALGLPSAVLGYWLVNGVSAGEPLLLPWSAALERGERVTACGSRGGASGHPGRSACGAPSRPDRDDRVQGQSHRIRHARRRGRSCVGILRKPPRDSVLPDRLDAGLRLRNLVPSRRARRRPFLARPDQPEAGGVRESSR